MTTTYGSIDESDSEFRRNNLANLFDDDEFDYLPLPEIEEDDDKVRKGKADKIAFKSIFGETLPFDSLNRTSFIPNQPILVKIINVETDNTHLLNPHLYCIEITHGNHTWKLYKRYRDIQSLHNELLIFKTKNIILPVITKEAKERRRSFVAIKQNLSKFPNTPESLVRTTNNIEKRKALLEAYLQSVLKCPSYRSHPQTLQFLDVSNLSFVVDLGPKLKEGMVKKKCGGRRFALPCCRGVCQPGRWMKRWLVLKDSFVLYVRPEDGRISDVLLMDQDFSVNFGLINTGWRNGLKITNLSRHLYLKCPTQRKATEWYEDIMTTVKESGQDFVKPNRYRSYVPPRHNSYCNWFVDGASYMTAVADALESAKEEIFITDWMLSPELYLKRPMEEGDKWRLDEILKRKADGGVKVFVLVYKELQMALGINSNYTKRALLSKNSENIRVMRHPDGIKLWSHHEKCVVIDQKIAFLGGIDLCYGRWDTRKHRLTDFGSIHLNNIYSNEDGDAMKGRDIDEKTKKESTSDPPVTQTSIQSDFDAQSTNHVEKKKILIKNGSEGSTDETTPSTKGSLDHVTNTLDAYLQKSDAPAADAAFATAAHAVLPDHSEVGGDNVIPKKEDEEELEEAFKAYIDKSGEGSRRRQIHDAMSHDWKSSLPTRLKKAIFERKKRKESEGDDDSGDEDCDKAEKYAWIGDKMRFGSGDPSMSQDNDSVNLKITKPDVVPKSSRKLKLRSLADFKIMFHRHHSQTVDVTSDSGHRPWDEKVFTTKECDETDKKLDDKLPPEGTEGSLKIWVGKDYVNFIFKDFVELDKPFTDMIDRRATPRMPWHDVGAVVFGKAARDVARHFIQRWNYTKLQKAKANSRMPLLLPRSNSLVTIPKWFSSNAFCCNCQILRSASEWSAGITVTENSIHNAYTDLILSAKHYIYIENQFFISIASDRTVVNQISAAIYERIVAAHRAQKNFRVYVLLPLLPAFEGQLGTNTGTSIQAVIHWNYASISRGNGNSLLERLVKAVPDPFKYISFYGLRKHENMLGKLTTELVYVHAKLMIVDDQSVIVGSANINDRSMLGSRDSELALVVQDTRFVDSTMDGQPYRAGAFACSLRKSLFREHLGLFGDDTVNISDPVAEEFYKNVWLKQASINTSIYSKVFNCIPTDEVLTLDELRSFQKLATVAESNPEQGKKMLEKVRGQLVLMPLLFLSKEYLAPLAGTREALAPTVVWT